MFLILFAVSALSLSATPSEDALTHYIVSRVLERVKSDFSGRAPSVALPVKSAAPRLFSGDTLRVPAGLWGYQTTNDYRLHFYAAHLLYFRAFQGNGEGEGSADSFFLNAGRAADRAAAYAALQEKKDGLLPGLLAHHYLYLPYASQIEGLVLERDFRSDSLGFLCLVRAALAYRCDSTRRSVWLRGSQTPDYGISGVTQSPRDGGRYRLEISLFNSGTVPAPFQLFLDGSGRDTMLALSGFSGDTAFPFEWDQSLLKAVIDPDQRLLDFKPENQQFVSSEFLKKRRVAVATALLVWNLVAGGFAFLALFLLGLMIPPILRLYYRRNAYWAALFTLCFIAVKVYIPAAFFGFNLWGFVYLIHWAAARFSTGLFAAGLALVSAAAFWVFQRDGVSLSRYRDFFKYFLSVAFLEPLLWIPWL